MRVRNLKKGVKIMNIYKAEMRHSKKQYEGQLYIETDGKHYLKCKDEIMPDAFLQTYEINPNTLRLVKLDLNQIQKKVILDEYKKTLQMFLYCIQDLEGSAKESLIETELLIDIIDKDFIACFDKLDKIKLLLNGV